MVMMHQDIIQEILLRLPVKSLVRSTCLSQKWHDFVTYNKSFRSNYMSRHTGGAQQVLQGFFLSKFVPIDGEEPVRFLPASSQQGRKRKRHHNTDGDNDTYLTDDDDGNTIVFPVDTNTPLNFLGHDIVHVMGFSNGCLLTSLERDYPMTYMICNPVNKQHIVLPKPNLATRLLVHGFTCDATLTHYKVVRALLSEPMQGTNILTLEVFSSDLRQWRQVNGTCPFRYCLNSRLPFSAVINNGVTYLPGYVEKQGQRCICILVIDQSKEMLEVMETPPREDDFEPCQFFGMSNGLIVYGYYELHHLIIWLLNDKGDGKREWSLKHKVNLKSNVENYLECAKDARNGYIQFIALHPTNTEVFFLGCGTKRYQYHVKKSRFEFICDFEQQGRVGWPYNLFPYTYPLIGPHLFRDSLI